MPTLIFRKITNNNCSSDKNINALLKYRSLARVNYNLSSRASKRDNEMIEEMTRMIFVRI